MVDSNKKSKRDQKKRPIFDGIIGVEGISDVEEKKQKIEKKLASEYEVEDEEKKQFLISLENGISMKIESKDILYFLFAQLLPLLIISGAFFVPGVYFLLDSSSNLKGFLIIIIILGVIIFIYSFIRLLATFNYQIKITSKELKWHSITRWITIENTELTGLKASKNYYFYLIKVGGIIRIGIEAICIFSGKREYWLRAYPLRKSRADQLVKIICCWLELTKPLSNETSN
ncbi:MAG: hypothetical protein JXA54_16035 [Candidatus Heimdallarchaeota archaeon]|nr:hypothetical protein [Candidatus Heimdallarchaeota archaeon]